MDTTQSRREPPGPRVRKTLETSHGSAYSSSPKRRVPVGWWTNRVRPSASKQYSRRFARSTAFVLTSTSLRPSSSMSAISTGGEPSSAGRVSELELLGTAKPNGCSKSVAPLESNTVRLSFAMRQAAGCPAADRRGAVGDPEKRANTHPRATRPTTAVAPMARAGRYPPRRRPAGRRAPVRGSPLAPGGSPSGASAPLPLNCPSVAAVQRSISSRKANTISPPSRPMRWTGRP